MRKRAIALAAAAATALSGCSMISGGEDAEKEDASSSSSSSSASETSGVVTGDPNENGAKAAGLDPDNLPKPIAEATLRPESDDVESTKIELLKLRKDDNVMLAIFRLTGEGRGNESKSAADLLGSYSFDPVFIDMKNLEKYNHVGDLTSSINTSAPLGKPVYIFTAFPLPKDGVKTMDLQMTPVLQRIEDVPMPQ